jgi:hypothetical protein
VFVSYVQRFSPAIAVVALVVAIGSAVATHVGPIGWSGFIGAGNAASSPPADSLTRVMFPVQVRENSAHHNNMISLAHNWGWDPGQGWTRDPGLPSVALTLESFYNDLAELNFDMRPPGRPDNWPGGRAMGFAARHDGSYSTLTLGGQPYNAGSAGVKLTGGTGREPVVAIFEGEGGDGLDMLRVQRPDGTASLRVQGGDSPALSFAMAGPPSDAPVFSVKRTDRAETAQFALSAGGKLQWGDGRTATDVSLSRTGPGRIETDGELSVSSLRIGGGAALQSVRLQHVDLKPARLGAQASRDDVIELRGIAPGSLVFVNGPEQPAGVAIANVRVAGEGRIALRFINMSANAASPAAGRYALFIVEPNLGE